MTIRDPVYFHREYINDIPKDVAQEQNWVTQSKRAVRVALPFISLYKPLSFPLSLGLGALRAYGSLTQLLESQTTDEKIYHLAQTSVSVIALAATIFAHPIGMLITTGQDILIDLSQLIEHIKNDEKKEAAEKFASIVNNTLYFALFCTGGVEIAIASFTMQILLGLYHSQSEFGKGNYLESVGHFGMALVRGHQLFGQVKALHRKKTDVVVSKPISNGLERRAVIDVGSGSTKVCIADVDPKTNQVVKVILKESYAVPYQAALEKSPDHSFNSEVREQGLRTFSKIDQVCKDNGVQKVTAVATEAFRKSMNGESFAKEINEKTQLPLRIISQKEEGAIAYFSAASMKQEIPADKLVVWDIGTGSFQMTAEKGKEDVVVFMGDMGSVPFKNYVMEVVHGKETEIPTTLHPLTEDEYTDADRFARAVARKAFPYIKEKIKHTDGKVVGVGRLFTNSLAPFAKDKEKITRSDLRNFIDFNLGKTKEEMNDPYSDANLSNAILALGFMKALHIHEINALDAATSQGMLTHPQYWSSQHC